MLRKFLSATTVLLLAVSMAMAGATTQNDPRDVGARYGQAVGASEVCPGFGISEEGDALRTQFKGRELEVFKAQAALVYKAWQKIARCVKPNDPNPCRITIEMSCKAAVAEIGPNGSAHPNLIKVK